MLTNCFLFSFFVVFQLDPLGLWVSFEMKLNFIVIFLPKHCHIDVLFFFCKVFSFLDLLGSMVGFKRNFCCFFYWKILIFKILTGDKKLDQTKDQPAMNYLDISFLVLLYSKEICEKLSYEEKEVRAAFEESDKKMPSIASSYKIILMLYILVERSHLAIYYQNYDILC